MYNPERLADLDELVLRCRTRQAKEYISEAVSCYRGGAYRAVIVNTWIAIVYDLIDKIRELSLSGDPAAKKTIEHFEAYQKQIDEGNEQAIKSSLEFERNILKTAKEDMQFFDQQQYVDLQRLREDRHRCAHPSFHREEEPYKASAEQARIHLRNAIVHVLSQPPIQGKSAINKIITLISSQYFPHEVSKAKSQLEESELAKPTPALIRGLVDALMFGYLSDDNPLKFKRSVIPALNAILLLHRELTENRIKEQTNKIFRMVSDENLIGAIFMATQVHTMWSNLSSGSKAKITSFIDKAQPESSIAVFRHLIKYPEFHDDVIKKISSLDDANLSEGIIRYELAQYSIDRAIELYGECKNWDKANKIYETIINPLQSSFTKQHIKMILSLPASVGADLIGSHGFSQFIDFVKRSEHFTPDELDDILESNQLSSYK